MNPADILPPKSETVDAIYAAYKVDGDAEESRGYLGASIIGHNCERYLWYNFRQCTKEDISGRIYRLFETGDLEEIRMVKDLRRIGCTVHEVDPNSGEQFEVNAFGGHFSGHMDGAVFGLHDAPKTWHVFEGKTHNKKSFADLEKKGVKESKPQHYSQMQAYMGLTGMTRALYLARNKDTDHLYCERVRFDKVHFDNLMEKARRVITSNEPPARLSDRPDWYECGWCDAKEICHATGQESEACATPSISCRQCCFATPDVTIGTGGRWTCDKLGKSLSKEDQDRACERLLYVPGIVDAHSDPVGYGVDEEGIDYIDYQVREPTPSGLVQWRQGGGGGWSGEELRCVSVSTLGNPLVTKARGEGAAVTHHESRGDVIARYNDDTSFVVWTGHAAHLQRGWQEKYGTRLSDLSPIEQDENLDYIGVEYEARAGVQAAVIVDTNTNNVWIKEGKA